MSEMVCVLLLLAFLLGFGLASWSLFGRLQDKNVLIDQLKIERDVAHANLHRAMAAQLGTVWQEALGTRDPNQVEYDKQQAALLGAFARSSD